MVSTRHHPRPFPEPDLPPSRSPTTPTSTTSPSTTPATSSPTKRSTRKSTGDASTSSSTPSKALTRRSKSTSSRGSVYTHTPPPFLLAWLLFSLPLVIWDFIYVLGRPHTMPGGNLHNYLWKPYALYGNVDRTYGFHGMQSKQGFVGAQAALNVLETAMYAYYLAVLGRSVATGDGFIRGVASKLNVFSRDGAAKIVVHGEGVALAVLLCFAASIMTLSKTAIYGLNEAFSGWDGIGHNDWATLFWLWIVPNGAWIVGATYMTAVLGAEILDGMGRQKKE